ncbi:ketosynthase chain-length factor [Streptomyces sp. Li-HN-5-11]|uniref:ketosynthase chain-length factor n=1 Tax=Streptomyces sp. Li-HN-5-11 TaxID=3075432 RepID=UPI0028B1D23D|nr:ketosynthase chain-length factor [Streptomyces sp. Li-HN-5-11]WNM36498.1 ketosynthase chain-length factor [Streptomyces sp. Li-HN-5-11]
MGVLAPTGLGAAEHWRNTLAADCRIGRISRFDPEGYPSRNAGQIEGFVPEDHLPSRLLPQTDHMTRLALVAADWAVKDAGLDTGDLPEYSMGVVTASSAGGFEFGQRELQALWSKGSAHVSVYQSFAWFYAVNSGQISIRHGLRGPSGVLVTEQAGGLDAVAQAKRHVMGGTPSMLGGGVDGSPCPWGWVAQLSSGRISVAEAPDRAYLPFDADANGYVPGEGGALFVLESAQSAKARGASVHGEIAGYAATFDPPPGSGRPPTLRRAAELALDQAELSAAEVDVVFADGAGTPELDRREAAVLRDLFGPYGVPVTVPKSLTGRLAGGGAALDLATALLAMRHGTIPPTANVRPAPEHELDLVLRPREAAVSTALVLARGHGGFNAAMVIRKPAGPGAQGGPRRTNMPEHG